MMLGKRRDNGKWQVLHTQGGDPTKVHAHGAWAVLLHVKDDGVVDEYRPTQPKWELVR